MSNRHVRVKLGFGILITIILIAWRFCLIIIDSDVVLTVEPQALIPISSSGPSYNAKQNLKHHGSPAAAAATQSHHKASSNNLTMFTYEELARASNGFSVSNLVGEGGFGCVFKGSLSDGKAVAIKQLRLGGGQGEKEFRAEVETISRVHHRHLVSLVGYCIAGAHRILVYEYVPNGTLDQHLHRM